MDVWKKIQLSPFVPPIWTLVGSVPGVAGSSGPVGPVGPRGPDGRSSTFSTVSGDATFTSDGVATVSNRTGATNGSNASAGKVGEIFTSTVALGSGVSVSNIVAKTVTSITLTAGRWLIFGLVGSRGAAGTITIQHIGAIHTTTDTLPSDESFYAIQYPDAAYSPPTQPQITVPPQYVTISGSTTYYLVARVQFSVSTCVAFGRITAVRI